MALTRAHPARAVLIRPSPRAQFAGQRLSTSSALCRQSMSARMHVNCSAAITAEVMAAVEPKLAAVWGMAYAPTRIHIMLGTPASVTEVVPLQLEDLRPANLTKPALLEFLQSSLTTRAAVQKGVQCMMLSASAYLPSQLDTINSLAHGIGVSSTLCISAASVHALLMPPPAGLTGSEFQQRIPGITHTVCQLLAPTFGKVQLLSAEHLTAARAAEQTLKRRLRLWHPPTWGETLQQKLMCRSARRKAIAARSLMGPPSLAAARKLVYKQGLHMMELQATPPEQALPAAAAVADDAAASSSDSNLLCSLLSGSSRRRRPSARAAGAAGDAGGAAAGDAARKKTELVLVISCWPLEVDQAMQVLQQADAFTDVLLA
ncbi:hypothetical protein COO60DRAFT_690768 [Scenedesmus sp. NREL 46B-D3]|nr:hypothetical protein COO60DRAFT_690768 [Scenedesmus sp. NREL 46B-D3]